MPAWCSIKSKYRMAILLKNGKDHLKIMNNQGKLVNPIWYNYLSKNKYGNDTINKMINRVQKQAKYIGCIQVLIVYDNYDRKAQPLRIVNL